MLEFTRYSNSRGLRLAVGQYRLTIDLFRLWGAPAGAEQPWWRPIGHIQVERGSLIGGGRLWGLALAAGWVVGIAVLLVSQSKPLGL